MRRVVLMLSVFVFVLASCFYDKEAKKLMKDDAVKEEIERAVIETAKNEYGVDVEVDLSTVSFAPANSKLIFPLTTDERLQVKTEVVGSKPSYHFKAYVSIYDTVNDTYRFDPHAEDAVNLHELRNFGELLLTRIFNMKHKVAFENLKAFDPHLDVDVSLRHDFFGYYFDDVEERKFLHQAFFEDYKMGKFKDATYYEEVFPKYVEKPEEDWRRYDELIEGSEPCVPSIWLKTKTDHDGNEYVEQKLDRLVEQVEQDESLPNGTYFIKVEDEDMNKADETLLICR